MSWTAEEDDALRRMWDEGRYTRLIGEALRKSKNAVIGRAHRLKLEPRKPGPSKGVPKTGRNKRVSPPRLVRRHINTSALIKWELWPETVDPVPFLQLEEHHCRSVEGKDAQGLAMYCGRHRVAIKKGDEVYYVSSWCAEHAQRYHAPDNS